MEAGHVGVHVPVVVANVAFCASVGHGAKPERRRELVGLLKLWWRKDTRLVGSKIIGRVTSTLREIDRADVTNKIRLKHDC